MRARAATLRLWLLAGALLCAARPAAAGSTEPELAIADATATADAGVVTLEIRANFEYSEATRLGYPLAVVATQGTSIAQLFLDGRVTLASGGGAPAPLAGAPGVVAITPTQITAVLPPVFTAAGAATVRLEAAFGGSPLRSNSVEVQW